MLHAASLALALALPLQDTDPEQALRSKDPLERLAAVEAIADGGHDDAEALLLDALEDDDWEVREHALRALARHGSVDGALDALCEAALEAPARRMRLTAARSAGELDATAAVELLAKELGGKQAERALEAVEVLAEQAESLEAVDVGKLDKQLAGKPSRKGPPKAAVARTRLALAKQDRPDVLADLLGSEDLTVVCAALEAVAGRPLDGDEAAVTQLLGVEALDDVVRRRALTALVACGTRAPEATRSALEELLGTAGDLRRVRIVDNVVGADAAEELFGEDGGPAALLACSESEDEAARALAARGLGRLGGDRAAEALASLAKDDASPRVRLAAIAAWLACHPIPEDAGEAAEVRRAQAAFLTGRLEADSDAGVREQLAVELALADTPEVDGPLRTALSAPEWRVSCAAAVSLGLARTSGAIDALAGLVEHEDWRLRGAAAVGLGHTADARAMAPMIALLDDDEPAVVASALAGLQRASGRYDAGPDSGEWRDWWEEAEDGFRPLDPLRTLAEKEKYGYGIPDAEIYRGLDVVVLESTGDEIQRIFERLEIAHRTTQTARVTAAGLHPGAIFVSNCTGEVSEPDVERLSWFVLTGGQLFASCWALHETVEKIYPGVVRKLETKQEVLDDVPATVLGDVDTHRFLRGAFRADSVPVYHLEGAHLIEVLAPERCEVLIDSPIAAERHGGGNLAVWFDAGHGRILDSANHFDLQGLESAKDLKKPEQRQAYAIDHLGLTYAQLREIQGERFWSNATKAARFVPDDSAFRFVTNFVRAKRLGL